jgi:hypothetical protein
LRCQSALQVGRRSLPSCGFLRVRVLANTMIHDKSPKVKTDRLPFCPGEYLTKQRTADIRYKHRRRAHKECTYEARDGEINWARFITTLIEVGYDDVIAIEHEDGLWYGSPELNKKGLLLAKRVLEPYLI